MVSGTSVVVLRTASQETDRFGNVAGGTIEREEVENVLVSPGATTDMEASRPEGVQVALTLHFPKTYSKSLKGCSVALPAPWEGTYRVVGDPRPYMDANTPSAWHMPVEVEAAHG